MLYCDIGVIIPAFNEDELLPATLETLNNMAVFKDILVIDDGSTDNTRNVALEKGANLISLEKNYGKGHALKVGIENIENSIVVIMDADIGETATEMDKLIHPIVNGNSDVTIGKISFTQGKGGLGMVKGLSQLGYRLLTGSRCSAILSGQRAFRRDILDPNIFNYRRFGVEFGMTVDLSRKDIRILEVPIRVTHRLTGKDIPGYKHRLKQFIDILYVIILKSIDGYFIKGMRP